MTRPSLWYVSPFVWPIAALAVAAFALAVWKLFQILLEDEYRDSAASAIRASGRCCSLLGRAWLLRGMRLSLSSCSGSFALNAEQAPESLFIELFGLDDSDLIDDDDRSPDSDPDGIGVVLSCRIWLPAASEPRGRRSCSRAES